MDEIAIVNRSLSATDVYALYDQSSPFSLNETSANGHVVGTLIGKDADAGDTLSYSLTDDAEGVSPSTVSPENSPLPTTANSITRAPAVTPSQRA